LEIETENRVPVGSYTPRRWPGGGTIALSGGAEIDLGRAMSGIWRLRPGAGQETLASIRPGSRISDRTATLIVRRLPDDGPEYPLMILVGLAVLTLEQSLVGGPTVGSG
jgi:hypothetical protein